MSGAAGLCEHIVHAYMTGRGGLSLLWAIGSWRSCQVHKGALAAARLNRQRPHAMLFVKPAAKRPPHNLLTAKAKDAIHKVYAEQLLFVMVADSPTMLSLLCATRNGCSASSQYWFQNNCMSQGPAVSCSTIMQLICYRTGMYTARPCLARQIKAIC